jgi:hypothetical protein
VNLPAGWALTAAACSDGSDPSAIDLAAGEVVTCTFSNLNPPEGSITIIKDATPLDASGNDIPFGFSGDLGIFELMDPSDPSVTVADLPAGSYTITEGALSGDWKFDEVVCEALSWSADGQSVTVNLAEGEAAVCTFYNGALPFTGPSPLELPLFLAGLAGLTMGLGLLLMSRRRQMA